MNKTRDPDTLKERLMEYPRPSFDDFFGIYPAEQIQKAQKRLSDIKERIEQQQRRELTADGLDSFRIELQLKRERQAREKSEQEEALLARQIEHFDWLGGEVFRTNEYDDWFNNTDLVVRWQSEEGEPPLHLAIDITVADVTMTTSVIRAKEDQIFKTVESGKLTTVEFADPDIVPEGRIEHIPRVTIATTHDVVEQLRKDNLALAGGKKTMRKLLEEHPLQIEFLELIRDQLQAQIVFALSYAINEAVRRVGGRDRLDHAARAFVDEMVPKIRGVDGRRPYTLTRVLEDIFEQDRVMRSCIGVQRVALIEQYRSVLQQITWVLAEKRKSLRLQAKGGSGSATRDFLTDRAHGRVQEAKELLPDERDASSGSGGSHRRSTPE